MLGLIVFILCWPTRQSQISPMFRQLLLFSVSINGPFSPNVLSTLLKRVQKVLQKARKDTHWAANTALSRGGRQDRLNPDTNLGMESHDIAGGSKHKHKDFVKRPMLLEREPEENTSERPPPTSSHCLLESLQLVSALTNYLKWPSERFPVQTRPSPTLASALVGASLTLSTE